MPLWHFCTPWQGRARASRVGGGTSSSPRDPPLVYRRFAERGSLIGTPISGEFRATWLPGGSSRPLREPSTVRLPARVAIRNPLRMRLLQWDAYHGFQLSFLGLGTLRCNLLEE